MIDVASYHELADAGLLSVKLPNGTQVCLICYDGEVTAFLEKLKQDGEPARLPASGRELAEGRHYATKMWPDLKPRVIWNVSKVSARSHASR